MNTAKQIVVSASRRTDIPAFYMPWFMRQVDRGFFEVVNPFNRQVSVVAATPKRVHTFVFWSKNFGPFLDGNFGEILQGRGYQLFFNFTINSQSTTLEPNVPSVNVRLEQLDALCKRFGPETINWRFDPLCFYKVNGRKEENNLGDFKRLAAGASCCGVSRCVTSFMDDYVKIRKRMAARPEFGFVYPDLARQQRIVQKLKAELSTRGMDLYLCCEKELLESLPARSGVKSGSCIPNDLLVQLYGGDLSFKKDRGQRVKAGCGCMVSVDVGSYQRHPCYHNCLFCYANPTEGRRNRAKAIQDEF